MSRVDERLPIRQAAKQVIVLIDKGVAQGLVRPRAFESVRRAIIFGDGFPLVIDDAVVGYCECRIEPEYHSIHTMIIDESKQGNHYGIRVMANRLEKCWQRDPEKPVVLSTRPKNIGWYKKFGFMQMVKFHIPEFLLDGRTMTEWLDSDREWMMCTHITYSMKKEGGFHG